MRGRQLSPAEYKRACKDLAGAWNAIKDEEEGAMYHAQAELEHTEKVQRALAPLPIGKTRERHTELPDRAMKHLSYQRLQQNHAIRAAHPAWKRGLALCDHEFALAEAHVRAHGQHPGAQAQEMAHGLFAVCPTPARAELLAEVHQTVCHLRYGGLCVAEANLKEICNAAKGMAKKATAWGSGCSCVLMRIRPCARNGGLGPATVVFDGAIVQRAHLTHSILHMSHTGDEVYTVLSNAEGLPHIDTSHVLIRDMLQTVMEPVSLKVERLAFHHRGLSITDAPLKCVCVTGILDDAVVPLSPPPKRKNRRAFAIWCSCACPQTCGRSASG